VTFTSNAASNRRGDPGRTAEARQKEPRGSSGDPTHPFPTRHRGDLVPRVLIFCEAAARAVARSWRTLGSGQSLVTSTHCSISTSSLPKTSPPLRRTPPPPFRKRSGYLLWVRRRILLIAFRYSPRRKNPSRFAADRRAGIAVSSVKRPSAQHALLRISQFGLAREVILFACVIAV
jgi:hypothetical protein